jgi:hypothetical protein
MLLPEFNEFGDLPIGIHPASLSEVIARFGSGAAPRVAITARLERIYQLAMTTGQMDRIVVFGSYVSDVNEPNDVDVILVMNNAFRSEIVPLSRWCCSITLVRMMSWEQAYSGCVPTCCLASLSSSFWLSGRPSEAVDNEAL